MTTTQLAQIIGSGAIFILFGVKLYIIANRRRYIRYGRAAIVWTAVYVYFLFLLRLVILFDFASSDQVQIVSGFSALIPLVGVLSHLFLQKHEEGRG